jgi:hypothetical protein
VIHLPIGRQGIPVVAKNPKLAAIEGGVEIGEDFRAEIFLERLRVSGEGREDDAAPRRDLHLNE